MREIVHVAKRPIGLEPWIEFGSSRTEYEKWAAEACSIACMRSLLLSRDGNAPSLWQLTKLAIDKGVFVDLETRVLGAYHRPLSDWLNEQGFSSQVVGNVSEEEVWNLLDSKILLLSINLAKLPLSRIGSHLVLVYDKDRNAQEYLVHDSAGLLDAGIGNACRVKRMALAELSNAKGIAVEAQFCSTDREPWVP